MSRSTTVLVTTVLAALLAAGALATRTSRAADECLSKPNATAPRGSHWYYRIERPTQRRCWFLGAEGEKTRARRAQPSPRPAPKPTLAQADASGGRDLGVGERKPEIAVSSTVLAATRDARIARAQLVASPPQVEVTATAADTAATIGGNHAEHGDDMPLVRPVLVPDFSAVEAPQRRMPRMEEVLAALAGVLALAAFVTARMARRRAASPVRRQVFVPPSVNVELPRAASPPPPPEPAWARPYRPLRKPGRRAAEFLRPPQTDEDIESKLQRLLRDWERAAA
jgi:hypothetical protein